MKASHFAKHLNLVPHPEGGYFRETYRSGSIPMVSKGQTDFGVADAHICNETAQSLPNDDEQCVLGSPKKGKSMQASPTPLPPKEEDCGQAPPCRETPPTMRKIPYQALIVTAHREHRRPDNKPERNCLTSIVWMPTDSSNILYLTVNLSDHVHYYQGGKSFEFYIYDPEKQSLTREILGPNLQCGEKLQVAVRGGFWKCGRLLNSDCSADYCLIGEAVAPGFDFHDFSWVTEEQILNVPNSDHMNILFNFVHTNISNVGGCEVKIAEKYYE